MLENLIDRVGQMGAWGYGAVCVVVALECQALLGLFMPGESLVIAGGFLASQGVFDRWTLIGVVAFAAIVGDSISFEMGRHFKRDWLLKPRRWFRLRPEQLARVETFFRRHGAKSVFAGHFLHLLRAGMPFVAGMSRMHYPRFLVFNAAGCVFWATIFVLFGYYAGASWSLMVDRIGRAGIAIVGALLLAVGLGWWWWSVRRRQPR